MSDALGRVYTVHPTNAECFYLRMLLHVVKGPTSFTNLKTVEGVVCQTFREACQRRGMLDNDEHWEAALAEAAQTGTAQRVRHLFALLLTTCGLSNPLDLWEKYKNALSDDILLQKRRENPDILIDFSNIIYDEALIALEDLCLTMAGKDLKHVGLKSSERNAFCRELLRGIVFLDAPGGTGKTFLINLLLAKVRQQNKIALAVASSGIAATLLQGGRTAHSTFKLPLNLAHGDTPVCDISKDSGQTKNLQICSLIVWDESTMSHKRALEAVDMLMQDLKNSKALMGGVVVMLAGDFRQTLPVIPKSTPADELNACLKASYLWKNHEWLCERAILAPTNDSVSRINIDILNQLPDDCKLYKSIDSTLDPAQALYYPAEFLNSLEPPGLPHHNLQLKIGAPIILLRNLDPPKLCNGTRLVIKNLFSNLIEGTILTGCAKGEDVFIPRIPLIPSDLPFEFKRLQFPVRLAFAMTINKAQGQSLKVAGINLESPCFSHG
nr:ATP-dependent DNA helicase PIF1 [Biomphalaria glabrata]